MLLSMCHHGNGDRALLLACNHDDGGQALLIWVCNHGDCDQVVVTDLQNTQWKYFFPCGQWLAKSEGDGAICRDLIGSRDPLATRKGVGAFGLSGHFAIIYYDRQGLGKPKGKLAVFLYIFFYWWHVFGLALHSTVGMKWIIGGFLFVFVLLLLLLLLMMNSFIVLFSLFISLASRIVVSSWTCFLLWGNLTRVIMITYIKSNSTDTS